jgi:hypothetical protein
MSALLLEVEDNKMSFVMELLRNFSFINTQTISENKASFMQENKKTAEPKEDPLAEFFGIWADRDIDAEMLRKQAWRIKD